MLQKIWLYPPLAFARLGGSDVPCDNYSWGPNDIRPHGTGKTTVQPEETLHVAENGTMTLSKPEQITFKDTAGFKPVCPFFELHGEWTRKDGKVVSGPITPEVLQEQGLTLEDVTWDVKVGNLKAYHYTLAEGDRIHSKPLQLTYSDTTKQIIEGISPEHAEKPLVLANHPIPFGFVQVIKPTQDFPELRLRFTPAKGYVYAPINLAERLKEPDFENKWHNLNIPPEHQILNPEADWCHFVLNAGTDPRTAPYGLFANIHKVVQLDSLGMMDDVCDGIISCSLKGVGVAHARIVVGPPDYAPDRRPFISLADGLKDRVSPPEEIADLLKDSKLTDEEIHDLFERIYETMAASNLDAQNDRANQMNIAHAQRVGLPPAEGEGRVYPTMPPTIAKFPLTEYGREHHRRFLSLEVVKSTFREYPQLFEQLIRKPLTTEKFFNRQMPALMRGSNGYALHLTQRQYDLLAAWVKRLREEVEL